MQIETRRRRQQRWTATDRGMLVLVKIVMADDWSPTAAAAQLTRRVRDPRVLARMAARVRSAHAERPSEFARRAEQTLSHAQAHLRAA